ncbi:sensor domain-containing protein [Salsuginibacillus halophilus]|nr:bifunctional diguanylate cyclase/phosphodiesterase [Salsuginibacillus halophilus]
MYDLNHDQGMFLLTPDSKILDAFIRPSSMPQVVEGEQIGSYLTPAAAAALQEAVQKGEQTMLDLQFREMSGTYTYQFMKFSSGRIILRETEQAGSTSVKSMAHYFQQSPQPLLLTSRAGVIKDMNEAFEAFVGEPARKYIGEHLNAFFPEFTSDWVYDRLEDPEHEDAFHRAANVNQIGGEIERVHCTFVPEEGGAYYVIEMVTDNTSPLAGFSRWHEDALTGLPNRLVMSQKLQDALLQAEQDRTQCAVLFIDIDRFRLINETLGHVVGDQVLQLLAARLQSNVRKTDLLVRLGGDEFMLLISHVKEADEVEYVAERLLASLHPPLEIDGFEFHLRASIGAATYPAHGTTPDMLIKAADAAMFKAKNDPVENIRVYKSQMSQDFAEWFYVENDLQKALMQNEFELLYQPQFHIDGEKVCGVEVLVRWNHPQRGMLAPGQFLPVAEDTGLIVDLGHQVLKQACRQMKAWQQTYDTKIPISVNVSMKQFMQKDFVTKVENIILETGLAPTCLELEVTETVTMDIERTYKVLQQLKKLGVKISLDDFGTGYSSLQHLNELPFDVFKVDQSFVKKMVHHERGRAMVHTMLKLGEIFNVKVVVEGVETEFEWETIKTYGNPLLQGYKFSHPLTEDQFSNLLRQTPAED